jgi:uncharacterized membrane protein YbhN (UPF0104 family)
MSSGTDQRDPESGPAASPPRLLRLAHDLLAVLVPLGFVVFLWERREHFASVLDISALHVAVLCAIVALTWVVVAAQNFLLYRASGVPVGFWECVVLTVGSAFGNYLPMRLGTVVRAHYLKAVHGLRYARFGSVFGVRTILTVAATGVLGLVGTIGIGLGGGRLSLDLALVFGALIVLPVVAWMMPLPASRGDVGRVRRALGDLAEGARALRRQPGPSLGVLGLILVQQATLAMRFGVASIATGTEPPLALLLLLAPLAVLSSYLSVTPGGLGVREVVMGYVTFATGSSFASGVYVGAVDRAILLAMVGLFGGISFVVMWWKSREAAASSPPR